MDRKAIIVFIVCFALLLALPRVVNRVFPPVKGAPSSTNAVAAAKSATATNVPVAATSLPPSLTASTNVARPFVVATNMPEQTIVLSNENARYTFTSHGGGLKLVELLKYPESVSTRRQKQAQTHRVATLNTQAPVPVMALLGGEEVQGDGVFQLTQTDAGVRAEKTLPSGLTVVKEFRLSTNYLVTATVRLESHTNQSLSLPARELIIGTATPMGSQDKGQFVGAMWYNGTKADSVNQGWFDNRTLGCFPGTPRFEYRAGQSNVVWAAAQNQFFTLVAMPETPGLEEVVHPVDLPRPGDDENAASARTPPSPKGFQVAFAFPATNLAPNQTIEQQIHLFAGPKEYQTLARIADRFNNNVDLVMGYGGFFGGIGRGLLLGMNWLHHALHLSYGWAIVAITVIIKVVFWPLTQASTRSMKRMQALQPQMKAIQEKYKDDPVKMNRKVMEFMKENKVSPLGGCLPMLLQIPVFIGFYRMIQSAIELRGAPWLWVGDLSQPDTLFIIPGLNFPFNPLPLVMGATMLWQSHMTPPSPGMDPAQQKIMRYMPLIFLFMLYNFSAGLTLYWTVQNLLTIAQMKLTRAKDAAPGAPKSSALTPAPKKKK